MEDKQMNPERVLIVAMVEPGKPDPLTVLHRIQSTLEKTEGVVSVEIQQVGGVPMSVTATFAGAVEQLINSRSLESASNTPDFILASFLKSCLDTWNKHTVERDRWWGNRSVMGPGNSVTAVETSQESTLGANSAIAVQRGAADPNETQGASWQPPPLKPLDIPMGLKGAINQVFLFHEKFGVPWYTDDPQWPGKARADFRWRLMSDEFHELRIAMHGLHQFLLGAGLEGGTVHEVTCLAGYGGELGDGFRKRVADVARELVDLIYTIIGTAGEFGIDLAAVWGVVHQANMAKVGGGKNVQGKVLKQGKVLNPEGWVEPDVERALFGKP